MLCDDVKGFLTVVLLLAFPKFLVLLAIDFGIFYVPLEEVTGFLNVVLILDLYKRLVLLLIDFGRF